MDAGSADPWIISVENVHREKETVRLVAKRTVEEEYQEDEDLEEVAEGAAEEDPGGMPERISRGGWLRY